MQGTNHGASHYVISYSLLLHFHPLAQVSSSTPRSQALCLCSCDGVRGQVLQPYETDKMQRLCISHYMQ